jgi:hypothetical protein
MNLLDKSEKNFLFQNFKKIIQKLTYFLKIRPININNTAAIISGDGID